MCELTNGSYGYSDLSDPDANTCAGNWFSLPTQVNFTPSPAAADAHVIVNIVADQACQRVVHAPTPPVPVVRRVSY